MKFKIFYSPFFILLFWVSFLSCTKDNKNISQENKQTTARINRYLALSQSDTLSADKRLSYINLSCKLAKLAKMDSLLLKSINQKGAFLNQYDTLAALPFLKKSEQFAMLKQDTLYLGYSYLNLGDYYVAKNQDSIAFSYYHKSKIQFELKKDSSHVVYSLLTMSGILKSKDDYFDMESVNTEALTFINQTNKNYNYSCVYNNLGIALKETYDYEKSLAYYNKAKQYAEDELSRIIIDNNIASVYILNKQYQKAINLLLKAAHSKTIQDHQGFKSKWLNIVGLAYFKLNDARSLEYFNQALAIRELAREDYDLISSYMHLANYYKSKNNTLFAKQFAWKAYQSATKTKSIDERLDALEILASCTSGHQSRAFSSTYFRLNDSIIKVRQKSKNQFANIRYDFRNQKEQNQKLSIQKAATTIQLEREKNNALLLYFIVFVLIMSTIFVIAFFKAKNKKEKIKASYTAETRIAKKLHDELANDVYHAMTFAETQDLSTINNKEILLTNLDHIYLRTRNISKENSTIDTGIHFVPHLKEMMSNYSNDSVNVLVNGLDVLQNTALESNTKITLYRILQELLVNMKKHSQCSLVVITFKKTAQKIQLEYTDNGIGASIDKINLKNGLLNVENRIHVIKGTITFDNTNQKGFKVTIQFPI